jgi:hypothetical protein
VKVKCVAMRRRPPLEAISFALFPREIASGSKQVSVMPDQTGRLSSNIQAFVDVPLFHFKNNMAGCKTILGLVQKERV